MTVPQLPPLNGRILAEFYTASEVARRSTLRRYAKPPDEQRAREHMYDPVRRVVAEYFGKGRDGRVLERISATMEGRRFGNATYDETWHKSNRVALKGLESLTLPGTFSDVRSHNRRHSVQVGPLQVRSTVDFYAVYKPLARNGKAKSVGVIVNPAGVQKSSAEKRRAWINIECEVATRVAMALGIEINEIMYVELSKGLITRYTGPKKSIWAESEATCELIFRDWKSIRLDSGDISEEAG